MGSKLKAALALVAMFGLGTLSGGVLEFYRTQHVAVSHPPVYASHRIKKLKSELSLTADQEQALRQIFTKANERAKQVNEEVSWDLSDIHKDSVQAIRQVLSPEQNEKFEKMHRKAHALQKQAVPDDELDPATPNGEVSGANS